MAQSTDNPTAGPRGTGRPVHTIRYGAVRAAVWKNTVFPAMGDREVFKRENSWPERPELEPAHPWGSEINLAAVITSRSPRHERLSIRLQTLNDTTNSIRKSGCDASTVNRPRAIAAPSSLSWSPPMSVTTDPDSRR